MIYYIVIHVNEQKVTFRLNVCLLCLSAEDMYKFMYVLADQTGLQTTFELTLSFF